MSYVYFLILVAGIFVLSRTNINGLFLVSRRILRKESITNIFIAMLFFPGTVVHEFAHALMAILLFHKVRSIELFPQWENNQVRLGSVLYEKKDPFRGVLVGIAPLFAGMAFFFVIAWFKLFPNSDPLILLATSYGIFTISSTMFSSKQDLKDMVIALPIAVLLGGLIYVLFGFSWLSHISPFIVGFIDYINIYLLFSVIIHIILLVIIKLISSVIRI